MKGEKRKQLQWNSSAKNDTYFDVQRLSKTSWINGKKSINDLKCAGFENLSIIPSGQHHPIRPINLQWEKQLFGYLESNLILYLLIQHPLTLLQMPLFYPRLRNVTPFVIWYDYTPKPFIQKLWGYYKWKYYNHKIWKRIKLLKIQKHHFNWFNLPSLPGRNELLINVRWQ